MTRCPETDLDQVQKRRKAGLEMEKVETQFHFSVPGSGLVGGVWHGEYPSWDDVWILVVSEAAGLDQDPRST